MGGNERKRGFRGLPESDQEIQITEKIYKKKENRENEKFDTDLQHQMFLEEKASVDCVIHVCPAQSVIISFASAIGCIILAQNKWP